MTPLHPSSIWVIDSRIKCFISIIACLFLGAGNNLLGQNLVPNPSFEEADTLPWIFYDNFTEIVHYWDKGTAIEPSYCHTQTPSPNGGFLGWPNPTNIQMPRTGYASTLCSTLKIQGIFGFSDRRSYPTVKLKSSIPVGSKVYAEFYCSAHEWPAGFPNFVTNNQGMYLSKDSIYNTGAELILVTPQINNAQILDEYTDWVKVSGAFIANTELKFVTIGNFFTPSSTLMQIDSTSNPNEFYTSWFYLDDVKVRILNPQVPDTIRACKGFPVELIATGEENHQWAFANSPNQIECTDSIFTFYPDSSVNVLFYGSFDTLATFVVVDELEVDLGSDTVICASDDFWLSGPVTAEKYEWSTGATTSNIRITETGSYWLKANLMSCEIVDSIFVEVVDIQDVQIELPDQACLGDEMTLTVSSQPYATYLWNTGEADTFITVTEDNTYSIAVTNLCGTSFDTVEVLFEKCVCHFFLPSAFSPNGDGINDEFFPVFDCSIRNYWMSITDRWGNVVFRSTNPEESWQGNNVPSGIYNVHIFYQGLNELGQTVGDDFVQMLTVLK